MDAVLSWPARAPRHRMAGWLATQQQRLRQLSLGCSMPPLIRAVPGIPLTQPTPCTFTSIYQQHHGVPEPPSCLQPTACRGKPGGLHSSGVIPSEAVISPRTSLCHNTGAMSSYLKPTLPPEGRWRISLPRAAVSWMSQPFQNAASSVAPRRKPSPPLTHTGLACPRTSRSCC